jgi:hypothetical protein
MAFQLKYKILFYALCHQAKSLGYIQWAQRQEFSVIAVSA